MSVTNAMGTMGSGQRSRGGIVYILVVVLCCVLYAYVFATLPIEGLKDRHNYLKYAQNSLSILNGYASGGLEHVLVNEPLWLLVNAFLGRFMSPDAVVRTISGTSAFLVAVFAFRQVRDPRTLFLTLLFLLMPQVVRSHVIQLRQGLAISVFLTGVGIRADQWRWLIWIVTPFIHSTFFFVLPVAFALEAGCLLRINIKVLIAAVLLMIAVLVGAMVPVAGALGARQAHRVLNQGGSGIAVSSFLFWIGILWLYLFQGRRFLERNALGCCMIFYYLAAFAYLPATARIFQSTVLLTLIAGLDLRRWWWWIFATLMSFYALAQYVVRLGMPAFGWG